MASKKYAYLRWDGRVSSTPYGVSQEYALEEVTADTPLDAIKFDGFVMEKRYRTALAEQGIESVGDLTLRTRAEVNGLVSYKAMELCDNALKAAGLEYSTVQTEANVSLTILLKGPVAAQVIEAAKAAGYKPREFASKLLVVCEQELLGAVSEVDAAIRHDKATALREQAAALLAEAEQVLDGTPYQGPVAVAS